MSFDPFPLRAGPIASPLFFRHEGRVNEILLPAKNTLVIELLQELVPGFLPDGVSPDETWRHVYELRHDSNQNVDSRQRIKDGTSDYDPRSLERQGEYKPTDNPSHLIWVGIMSLLILATMLGGCLEENSSPEIVEPLDCGRWQDAREILTTRSHEAYSESEETPESIFMWRWGVREDDPPGQQPDSSIDWSMFPEEDLPPLVFDLRCAMELRMKAGNLAQPALRVLSSPSTASEVFASLQAEQERQGGACSDPCWIRTLGSYYRIGHGDSRLVETSGETMFDCDWPNGLPMNSYYSSFASHDPATYELVSFIVQPWEDETASSPEYSMEYDEISEEWWPLLLSDVLCVASEEPNGHASTNAQQGMADEVMDLLLSIWEQEAPPDTECCIVSYSDSYYRVGYREYHVNR